MTYRRETVVGGELEYTGLELVQAEQIATLTAERDRYREALEELAANKHSFHRPAGLIAKAALAGEPLPEQP